MTLDVASVTSSEASPLSAGSLVLPLSKSWRFNQQIADVFNAITGSNCVGHGRAADRPTRRGSIVIQCRTNATIGVVVAWLKRRGIRHRRREGDAQV